MTEYVAEERMQPEKDGGTTKRINDWSAALIFAADKLDAIRSTLLRQESSNG